jgi:hypothetical protein
MDMNAEDQKPTPWWLFWRKREDESWSVWILSWTWELVIAAVIVIACSIVATL